MLIGVVVVVVECVSRSKGMATNKSKYGIQSAEGWLRKSLGSLEVSDGKGSRRRERFEGHRAAFYRREFDPGGLTFAGIVIANSSPPREEPI